MSLLHQLDSPLMRRALAEAVLVGAVCGALGVHVLLRRLPFFTLAVAHATFPGVVLASILGVSLFAGGAFTALALVVLVAVIGSVRELDASTATGVTLAGAFAAGVLLQSAQAGGSRDLAAFLVGDIFTTSTLDLAMTLGVGLLVVVVLGAFNNQLVFGSFDPAGAAAAGVPTFRLDLLALALIALVVVSAVPAVGTVLVVALLVTPALSARLWVERVGPMMILGAGFGAFAGVLGMAASAQWGQGGGAAITLAAGGILLASIPLSVLRDVLSSSRSDR